MHFFGNRNLKQLLRADSDLAKFFRKVHAGTQENITSGKCVIIYNTENLYLKVYI